MPPSAPGALSQNPSFTVPLVWSPVYRVTRGNNISQHCLPVAGTVSADLGPEETCPMSIPWDFVAQQHLVDFHQKLGPRSLLPNLPRRTHHSTLERHRPCNFNELSSFQRLSFPTRCWFHFPLATEAKSK